MFPSQPIPVAGSSSWHIDSSTQSSPHPSPLVGSPQPIQDGTQRSTAYHQSLDSSPSPVLPSTSNPTSLSQSALGSGLQARATLPRRESQRTPRAASAFQRLSRRLSRLPQAPVDPHEWTVFGNIMESETASNAAQPSGRPDQRGRSRINLSRSDIEGGAGLEEGGLQSPESDPYLGSHFPFPSEASAGATESSETSDSELENASDSDSSHSSTSTIRRTRPRPPWYAWSRVPALPTLYRNILKCSVAYFIGSLFTYSPYLSGLISAITTRESSERFPAPSGHMVATVAVYFNPAKTIGGMMEADRYCLMGLAFAAFVSLGSMNMYWWFEVRHGWEWLADVLVILWIGLGMSFVAWMKLWMAKPTFNTACSMTAIILFVVVVKEGGVAQLLQVSFIVFVGSIISNLICCGLWPQPATRNLQNNMIHTLNSYSMLLKLLTRTFLLDAPLHHPREAKIQKAVADHQASFTSLKRNLTEAKSEGILGPGNGAMGKGKDTGAAYEDAVDSLNRLAQHLNGLRSGTSLQYDLAKAHLDGRVDLRNLTLSKKGGGERVRESLFEVSNSSAGAGAGKGRQVDGSVNDVEVDDAELTLKSAASMFGELVEEVGPPLKALSSKCTGAIHRLREAFEHRNKTTDAAMSPAIFLDLADKIERALFTFESTSNHALLRLYRRSDIVSGFSSRESGSIYSLNEYSENALTSGSDNENVFLVYFFIFTLQEFARELVSLVDAMGRIYAAERANAARGWWFQRIPKTLFDRIRALWVKPAPTLRQNGHQRSKARNTEQMSTQRRLSSYVSSDKRPTVASYFPKVRPHAPNTVQTPAREELSFIGRLKQTLWAIGDGMRDRKIKYAIKAGMATAILAAPAFFEVTRPVFVEYRGEWALISFFVVMSPTIGATNSLSIHRVLGTLFGAATAATVYSFFPENAVVLSIFGFFYSIPCFYYIVAMPQYATTGRFVLLTYNLTCLYCYNTRSKDVSVIDVAFHRSVAVTVGVAWAFVVSRFWWPSEARRELSKALGDFCLNIGWLYTRLVASNSFSPEPERHEETDTNVTEETSLIPKRRRTALDNSIEEFMAMEFHLQIKLIELQDLLKQTQHEPRLKGPFPIKLYRSILTSLQKILDNLHSMRCVTTREEWYTNVRRDFIIPVNRERREMVGNIILYFSTLASAFRLKAPLPPYLPPAEKARQELVDAIRKLDVVKNRDVKGSRQLLFFAYALTMKGITKELDYLGSTLQDAFGVIGQGTDAFEALFRDDMRGAEQSV